MALNLRSIICVPVRGKAGILGILYVDSDRAGHQYSYGDMLLTTAVGNSAGLAIENARMHQEMLEKQRIEQEISHAWIIQQGFLIKNWPEGETHFEVYGETRPAKTVGGDFYDFVRPDPDHIGLLIGDVSGKGIPAALTMAQLLAEFRVHAQHAATPGEMLEALNADLVIRSQRGMFCTLCYVLLDLRTGEVICANAGHQPVLCIGVSGAVEHGAATGPPTGILSDMAWKETSWSLAPGDTLLMYTDGIVEACDPAATRSQDERKDYGDDNLRRVARQMYGVHPKTLIDAVNKDVIVFCGAGAPHDDCTLVGARYLG
ncbi:MAG TPA: PP2C family protein-serine/threonine phosphatase [Candidatus Hydrogenedentes bacterium]|nr:PP2C family protein-serine/threonine phosphatase [Candidatus Hydrogenedentota bacterium]